MREGFEVEHGLITCNNLLLSGEIDRAPDGDRSGGGESDGGDRAGAGEAGGATEELKASDPMRWVGLMNTCKAQAEEIVMNELIYA